MYQDDALLQHSRETAHKIMAAVAAHPRPMRAAVIRAALNDIHPGLFAKVDRLAATYAAQGASSRSAYEEALRLALADEVVAAVQALGKAKVTGQVTDEAMRAQRQLYGESEPSAVGDSGDGLGNAGSDIAKFGENLLRSAACSPDVNTAILNQVQGQTARDVTAAGLSVAAGISQCARLTGQPSPVPPPPPAPLPAPDNTATYVAVGAAVLGIGAIAFFALRRAPAVPMTRNRKCRQPTR